MVAGVTSVPSRAVAVVAGMVITALVILGIVQRTVAPTWSAANLDSEASVATWAAAALLWIAAGVWVLAAASGWSRWAWVWAAVLAWLALDEGNGIHERLERWSGVDWQLLYLPVLAVAWLAWVRIVRTTPRRQALGIIGGGAAWALALALELVQNWGGEPIRASLYDPMMVAEETLEMVGALLFLLAALDRLRPDTPAGVDSPGSMS